MDFPWPIDKEFSGGLAPDSRVPNGAPFLDYMLNLKAMPVGSVFPEKITSVTNDTVSHPFPQLFRGERGDFILGSASIKYRSGRSGSFSSVTTYDAATPASTVAISSLGSWQHVSFEKLWFASNLNQLVFSIPSNPSSKVLVSGRNVRALGRHGRRLLLGGVSETDGSNWFTSDRWNHVMAKWRQHQPQNYLGHENMVWDLSWIVYLEPGGGADDIPYHIGLAMLGVFGNDEFDFWLPFIDTYLESGEVGLIPSKANASIYAIKELGDPSRVIVYGPDAITELTPNGYRYDETRLSELGIAGRGAVAGCLDGHVAVDTQFHLVTIANGAKRYNFASRLNLAGTIIVSYDETFGDYWISNGTSTYIWNGALGGPTIICPTSLVRDVNLGLIGFATLNAEDEYDVEVRFLPQDFGGRDWSHINTMQFQTRGISSIEGKCDSRQGPNDDWLPGPWMPAFSGNYVSLNRSGVELRPSLRGVTTLDNPARITSAEARYYGKAGNVRRGPEPRR